MKSLLIFATIVITSQTVSIIEEQKLQEWSNYKLAFNKRYQSTFEETYRLNIFLNNKQKIEAHNARFQLGLETFSMGLNKFADWTDEEVFHRMNGLRETDVETTSDETFVSTHNSIIPSTKDWRKEGAVTPVKNQGNCGGCWTFSITGALEGQEFITNGNLITLSEQELLDCSQDEDEDGCDGGIRSYGFKYVVDHKGLDTADAYPYEEKDNGVCKRNDSAIGTVAIRYIRVKSKDIESLLNAVATVGPISVGMDASSLQSYESGIYSNPFCSSEELTHAVLIVGYGTENNIDYWIIKNTWGSDWGEEGYFRIARADNNCGIATNAMYPIVQQKN